MSPPRSAVRTAGAGIGAAVIGVVCANGASS